MSNSYLRLEEKDISEHDDWFGKSVVKTSGRIRMGVGSGRRDEKQLPRVI